MSTIGAKVQCSPIAAPSAAATRAARDRGRIPARRLGERYREDRTDPVDDVVAEEERDVQPRLLDGDALQLPRDVGAVEAEEGADASRADVALAAASTVGPVWP